MKKRVLCLVLVVVMLLPTMIVPASAYSTDLPQGVQLYVGHKSVKYDTMLYADYSDDDIEDLLTVCDEFVMNCINKPFNYDLNGNAIITTSDINSISSVNISSNATVSNLKTSYNDILASDYLSNDGSSNCNLKYLADAQIDLANRIINQKSSATIWFCFPLIGFFPCALEYQDAFEEYAAYIKSQMSNTRWANNVRGFYWATENVGWSGKFNAPSSSSNPSSENFGNPHVKLMIAMANLVKGSYGKEFLWMPYTSVTSNTALTQNDIRMGYVANKTTIFDYILLQPGYYTHGNDYVEPLRRVAASATNNKVYCPSTTTSYTQVVGNSKVSGAAKIGVVMEIDDKIVNGGTENPASFYNNTYYEYTLKFNPIKANVPVIFYAGARDSIKNGIVFNYVKNFLNY